MRKWLIGILLFFLSSTPVLALTLTFSNTPSSIDQNQEFESDVFLECNSCSDSYLRGVFYPSGTNYFGYTQNNSGNWINAPGSQATEYFKVGESDLVEGSWSGKLKFKPDPADSAYSGPGEYSFKIGRYTAGGSTTWSDPVTIQITGPPPTPTSTLAPTPTPTTIPPTSVPSTSTPKPSSTPKPTPIPTKIPVTVTVPLTTPAVLGEAAEFFNPSSPTPIPIPGEPATNSFPWPAFILIGLGLTGLFLSIFFFLRSRG